MRLLWDGAFRALLLLVSGASALTVRPPTNVTVSCENTKVTVSWEYSTQQPETSFKVVLVSGADRPHETETTDRQYDLSHLIWSSEILYMENFYVTVTARWGDGQSEPVRSPIFTFNSMKIGDKTCQLDFPPVDLQLKDSRATVTFTNPFHFYKDLKEAQKPDSAFFAFSTSSNGGDEQFECTAREENCRRDVTLPEGVTCVTLGGRLFHSNRFGQVLFRPTKKVCSRPAFGVLEMMLAILLSIIALVVTVVVVVICKAWTTVSVNLPKCLVFWRDSDSEKHHPDHTLISPIEVKEDDDKDEGTDPAKTSLCRRPSSCSCHRFQVSISEDESEHSVGTECVSVDSEEPEQRSRSYYDCPQHPEVDMGEGERAIGYMCREDSSQP